MLILFDLVTTNGVTLVQSTRWLNLPVRHAFTTRLGGVSPTPYSSLNMAFHVGDQSVNVVENRARVCAALHMPPASLVAGEQVHGAQVRIVEAQDAGRGAGELETALPATDILVSATPGVALISFYADCVPLLLCDPVRRVIACAHAGWRGTLAQVGAVAVSVMSTHFGCAPIDVQVLMGPAIGPCCYVVSAQLAIDFQKAFGADVILVDIPPGGLQPVR